MRKVKNQSKPKHKYRFKEMRLYTYSQLERQEEIGGWRFGGCSCLKRHSWLFRCAWIQRTGCLSSTRYFGGKSECEIRGHHWSRSCEDSDHGGSHSSHKISTMLCGYYLGLAWNSPLWSSGHGQGISCWFRPCWQRPWRRNARQLSLTYLLLQWCRNGVAKVKSSYVSCLN